MIDAQGTAVRGVTEIPPSRRDFADAEYGFTWNVLGLARGVCTHCGNVFRRSALALTVVGVVCRGCDAATRARQIELGARDLYQLRTLGTVTGQH